MAAPGTVIFDILAKDRASEVFRHVGIEAKKTGAELEGLGSRGSSAMGKLAHAGKAALLGVAGVAAVTGVVAVKMAANFETQTSVLQTAAGETAAGLKVVRKGILDIAMSTGTTWQNLTEGMYQVEKAGYRGAAGLKVLTAAAQGAKEENADLSVVANAMTSVMASYHLGADKSVQVMNALKTAAAGSKDTMQNFAGSLSTVLPIASAAHISFAQVGGAIAGLTRHGTSAAEATQELANTIRNLQAPGAKAVKQMEQFGISTTDVSQHLGKRGISGTLEYLVGVISKKMGPSGLVLQDTFKKSKSAAQDMNTMLTHMGKPARDLAYQFLSNTINLQAYHKGMKKLPEDQSVMAKQFATLATQTSGFSDALRKGGPQATTMASILKTMLGGSTGLNTALMLTGENQAYVNEMTKRTSESMGNHAKQVEGWAQTQKLFNTRLDGLKQTVEVLGISLGTKLMPYAQRFVTWLQDGLQPGSKFRDVLSDMGKKAKHFGDDVKPIFTFIGNHPDLFTQIAKDAGLLAIAFKTKNVLLGGLNKLPRSLGGGFAGAAGVQKVYVTNPGWGGKGGGPKGGPIGTLGKDAETAAGDVGKVAAAKAAAKQIAGKALGVVGPAVALDQILQLVNTGHKTGFAPSASDTNTLGALSNVYKRQADKLGSKSDYAGLDKLNAAYRATRNDQGLVKSEAVKFFQRFDSDAADAKDRIAALNAEIAKIPASKSILIKLQAEGMALASGQVTKANLPAFSKTLAAQMAAAKHGPLGGTVNHYNVNGNIIANDPAKLARQLREKGRLAALGGQQ